MRHPDQNIAVAPGITGLAIGHRYTPEGSPDPGIESDALSMLSLWLPMVSNDQTHFELSTLSEFFGNQRDPYFPAAKMCLVVWMKERVIPRADNAECWSSNHSAASDLLVLASKKILSIRLSGLNIDQGQP